MAKEKSQSICFFQKYLTVWVALCMTAGVLIGKLLPAVPAFLGRFEYARVSIPVAILIWVMIYPMMMKVNFQSVKNVGKNPKGLFVTWVTNWLIKPFTMYGIAALFFYVVFKGLIAPDLAKEYLAGAVLLGAAPCTAMVFVWSTLTKGNPAYTVVQVATNDLVILVAFVPLVLQTFLIFFIAYFACKWLKLPHDIAAPAGMIGASNFFELSVAVAIALFGTTSPAALATVVGVLTEVPVMLLLVKIANKTKGWFPV